MSDVAELNLTITESAQDYLAELLSSQDDEVMGIRMFVNNPGTPKAETCIAYCRDDDVEEDDIIVEYGNLTARYELRSVAFFG